MADETQVAETTPAPAQTEAVAKPAGAKADAVAKPAEPTVTLTVSQYQAQMERDREYAEYKAAQAAALEAKENARLKAMAEKGDVEKALAETREREERRYKELETKHSALLQRLADQHRDAAISAAVAGRKFVGQTDEIRAQAARDFQDIVRASGRFSAAQDERGEWVVKETATGRPAKEVLAEIVKAKSYLFAAETDGGVGNGGNAADAARQGESVATDEAARQSERWLASNRGNQGVGLFPSSSRN